MSPSVHSNALKKKSGICGGPILRSIRGFIPSNDSGTCRSNGEKPCRSIRPRKVFGKCFSKCFVHRVWYRFPKKPILLPFFFFLLSLFFPSNSVERNIRIPMNPFRVLKIEKSMFRGGKEKKKKGKKQIEGKRFHRRISRIGRVRNVFVQYKPAESGLLFTLHGIHSSPAKRVKTQKSESLFVTSFDVAINSFEITAGYTGPNIRQPAPIFSRKFKFSANRRLGSRSQFKRPSSSFFSS